jgi:hypothetical protein
MSNHTLTYKEIMNIPAGRIMNTFINEYVLGQHPERWSNGQQKEIRVHWFEEHPRACAEDDGGYCSADSISKFSTDISAAMALANVLFGKTLTTKTITDKDATVVNQWATFSNVGFGDPNYNWKQAWAVGETMALAICRAALLAV